MDGVAILSDVVVADALRAALSVILLVGAWSKLRDPLVFRASVENYQLLPEAVLAPAAWLISLWELGCGLALLTLPVAPATALATAALLALVTGAVAVNLLRGRRDIDCGCAGLSGPVGEQALSWALVGRNALLLAGLWLAAGDRVPRALAWLDHASVAGATLALLGVYAAAGQLISNQPRLQAMKRH